MKKYDKPPKVLDDNTKRMHHYKATMDGCEKVFQDMLDWPERFENLAMTLGEQMEIMNDVIDEINQDTAANKIFKQKMIFRHLQFMKRAAKFLSLDFRKNKDHREILVPLPGLERCIEKAGEEKANETKEMLKILLEYNQKKNLAFLKKRHKKKFKPETFIDKQVHMKQIAENARQNRETENQK